ncbi:MAG: amylo-alpha-1,6-glucosidase [Vicinamibacterales bacterium]
MARNDDAGEQGLYHAGTRYLSQFDLKLNGHRPLLLSSTLPSDNGMVAVDLSNPDLRHGSGLVLAKGTLHLFRGLLLWEAACYQHLRLTNFSTHEVQAWLLLNFAADFADIFEARGFRRIKRGEMLPPSMAEAEVRLAYRGLDGVTRATRLVFDPHPQKLDANCAQFVTRLAPQAEAHFYLRIDCESGEEQRPTLNYPTAFSANQNSRKALREEGCSVFSSSERLNQWLDRSFADLGMLMTETDTGIYPFAGVPWFSCPFGRDGIITALEYLWINPTIAKGVLQFLAAEQSTCESAAQDAEPGTIVHEMRKGELASLNEIPFGQYYGSIDATPLFLVLAGAYYERTGDRDCIERLWGSLMRALEWIDRYGDKDGDGFVEYARRTERGLVHQGWKDSEDAVSHGNGEPAEGPIALCEVQGYVYQAKLACARLASALGRKDTAAALTKQAEELKLHFDTAFWCEDIDSYALALDGAKHQCRVRASNAGHALYSGIVSAERARRVAQTLLSADCFSGWGIRTLATGAVRYNPMSYHNGSIWPHDNALIAMGFARYGLQTEAEQVFHAMFDAANFMDLHRLPELFCGFNRRPDEEPVRYPVACAPQAWAAGAVFLLLQACIGLSFAPKEPRIRFSRPTLPAFCEWLKINDLRVPGATIDLHLRRSVGGVNVGVTRQKGSVEVAVLERLGP